MTISTLAVGAATTPTVIGTFLSHYLSRRKWRKKKATKEEDGDPAAEITYDEGIKVIRSFLAFAAKHTLEETQQFTATHVPAPSWVKRTVVNLPQEGCINKAEELLLRQLESYGPVSMERIGGKDWWKVRGRELQGEWIEMKKDYVKRTTAQAQAQGGAPEEMDERVMLYIHGGAYFFSSLDTHRYQIQRHARKLGGRAFAPAYRLAPQYPFPCALLDALASYLFLISPPPEAAHAPIHPSNIILAGDSAGGGCVISLLVCIRDLGLPMPAGADLFSPWVDLCHSFPSILTNAETDYIPGNGFHFKPSLAWPPVKGSVLTIESDEPGQPALAIDEQIQLYCPNVLLSHPLVSPVNHGSLGGLCPMLIHSGGGELLRDEQIYLAHKAANPERYPPSQASLDDYPVLGEQLHRYKPTRVQLQVFDGCAHVIPTLSITTPAKYMYRSAANFNLWALSAAKKKLAHKAAKSSASPSAVPSRSSTLAPAAAEAYGRLPSNGVHDPREQHRSGSNGSQLADRLHEAANLEPLREDDVQSEGSASSRSSSSLSVDHSPSSTRDGDGDRPVREKITVLGALPAFDPSTHMIRQRVSCHGYIRAMEDEADIPALNMAPGHVGRVHVAGPVSKWLETRSKYESKYAKELNKFRRIREEDYAVAEKEGYLTRSLQGERPPQCAMVSWHDSDLARKVAAPVDEPTGKNNMAVGLWSKLSAKRDKEQVEGGEEKSEERKEREQEIVQRSRSRSVSGPAQQF